MTSTRTHSPIASVNPYTSEVVREFPVMTEDDAGLAAEAAHRAFQGWRHLPPGQRAAIGDARG